MGGETQTTSKMVRTSFRAPDRAAQQRKAAEFKARKKREGKFGGITGKESPAVRAALKRQEVEEKKVEVVTPVKVEPPKEEPVIPFVQPSQQFTPPSVSQTFVRRVEEYEKEEERIRRKQLEGEIRVRQLVESAIKPKRPLGFLVKGAAVGLMTAVPRLTSEALIAGKKAGLALEGLATEPAARKSILAEAKRAGKKTPAAVTSFVKELKQPELAGEALGTALLPAKGLKTGVERAIGRRALVKSVPKSEQPFVKAITEGIEAQKKVKPTAKPEVKELFKVQELKKPEIAAVIGAAKETKGVIFGSAAARVLTRKTKLPKDIDIAVKKKPAFKEAVGEELAKKIDLKEIVTADTGKRGLIRGELPVPGAPRGLLGLVEPFTVKTKRFVKESGVKFLSFQEQTARKGLGTLQVLLERETRRAKDPFAFVESLELQRKFAIERGKTRVAKKLEKSIAELKRPEFKALVKAKVGKVIEATKEPKAVTTFIRAEPMRAKPKPKIREEPTLAPKIESPSVVPSRLPSKPPSILPSRIPSRIPSRPSVAPSKPPSKIPSRPPSRTPSIIPRPSIPPPSIVPTPSVAPPSKPPTSKVPTSRLPSSLLPPERPFGTRRTLAGFKIRDPKKLKRVAKRKFKYVTLRRVSPSLVGLEYPKRFKPITKKEAKKKVVTGVGVRPIILGQKIGQFKFEGVKS